MKMKISLVLVLAHLAVGVTMAPAAETRTATPEELALLTANPYFKAIIQTIEANEKSRIEEGADAPLAKCQKAETRLLQLKAPYAHAPNYFEFTYGAVCTMKAREYIVLKVQGTLSSGQLNFRGLEVSYDDAG
ncbi:MAG: hypothetical protein AB7P04_13355 [Bacteriovoracia bacterium]